MSAYVVLVAEVVHVDVGQEVQPPGGRRHLGGKGSCAACGALYVVGLLRQYAAHHVAFLVERHEPQGVDAFAVDVYRLGQFQLGDVGAEGQGHHAVFVHHAGARGRHQCIVRAGRGGKQCHSCQYPHQFMCYCPYHVLRVIRCWFVGIRRRA